MITNKQVIERLREYEAVFKPKFAAINAELMTSNPRIEILKSLLDADDAEIAFLDFGELVGSYLSIKNKTVKATDSPKPKATNNE